MLKRFAKNDIDDASERKKSFKVLKGKNFYQIFLGDYKTFALQNNKKQSYLSKLSFSGITKRWLLNSFGIMMIALIVIEMLVAMSVRGHFYYGIQQSINGRANELANILKEYKGRQDDEFIKRVQKYIQNFPDKKYMELTAFDRLDRIITTSTGVEPDMNQAVKDCENARQSPGHVNSWIGKLSSGEKVITVTYALYSRYNSYRGSIRYAVSLSNADASIMGTVIISILIGTFIMIFIFFSSLYFIRSILVPVREISLTAKKIAQGNFEAKIEKKYDDEIGELCDTINYMASELGTSEKMKNDFISSVSHELRTPLTAIKGWAETMHMDLHSDPEMIDKGMNVIINESERLCGLVEELLDFSRLQNGKMILIMERMDVLAELTEAVYMFKDRAKTEEKNLLYTEPLSMQCIIGDKNRLRQVFINIIDNSLKYTEKNATINIKALKADNMVIIEISDNGCGIPLDHLPKVKEKFYKANQNKRGSGIGLAVADEIVSLHHGTLEIKSEENVGTTVEIRLPIASSPETEK